MKHEREKKHQINIEMTQDTWTKPVAIKDHIQQIK